MKKKLFKIFFSLIDWIYRKIDLKLIRRTKNIRLIPGIKFRRGGKLSFAEWAHVIGIFQTIIYQNLKKNSGNDILDIGCGTGLLGIASEAVVIQGGSYTGLDVMKEDINFTSKHFNFENYKFIHFDIANPAYAKTQNTELVPWPVESNSYDLVTALSVWTHLQEKDALFYFKEINRVLRVGGRAIITFFYLDEKYRDSIPRREEAKGRFHSSSQKRWVYNKPAYKSENWFTTKWVKDPEDAIAVSEKGMEMLLTHSNLKLVKYYPGNWKEIPGIYFQDVFILEK